MLIAQQNTGIIDSIWFIPDALIFSIIAIALAQAIVIKITDNTDNQVVFSLSLAAIGLITNFILIGIYFFLEPLSVYLLGNNWFSYLTTNYRNAVIVASGIAVLAFSLGLTFAKKF